MRIFFSAGEPSGDQHSALLIEELQQRDPQMTAEGFGGPAMARQGCRLLFELTELAVMGFLRVLPLIAKFRRLVQLAEAHFEQNPPDAVVLVDFPGFNWWIARAAKKRGIPVFYYLPPQLWGWAPWRVRRVRKWVDHVICTLPFEYEWYRKRGVSCTWVGHPFFDEVATHELNQELVERLRSTTEAPVVALLPGSRNHEVTKNWPVMLQAIQRVSKQLPNVRWIVGNYKPAHETMCRQLAEEAGVRLKLEYVVGQTSEVIEAAACCLMVSGSISLELLARNRPGIVLYRVPRIGLIASWFLMKCRFITLTNLIADSELMPEFISCGNPESDVAGISQQILQWLTDGESLRATQNSMALLAGHAAAPGATTRAAELLIMKLHVTVPDAPEGRKAA